MFSEIENKKVYVYCLASVVTGGCELLHQLVSFLNDNGREAYIVYVGEGNKEIPKEYKMYNIRTASSIVDSDESIVVIDEGFMYLVSKIHYAHCIFWWLSVDNFFLDPCQLPFHTLSNLYSWNMRTLLRGIRKRFSNFFHHIDCSPKFSINELREKKAFNAYQSEYARLFLQEKGFSNIVPLKDYINIDFITHGLLEKEDIVLYNPKKGFSFTKRLMEMAPNIKWVPLINLTRRQMLEKFQIAKVYIDFGNHPGKDRIPREAALNRCVVITGKRGSANNDVDIPIPNKYKFDEKYVENQSVIKMIDHVFANFTVCLQEQSDYRTQILKEKKEFEQQIRDLFRIEIVV